MNLRDVEWLVETTISPLLHQALTGLLSTCFTGPNDDSFKVQSYWRVPPTWRWIIFDETRPVAQLTVHDKVVGSTEGDLRLGVIADVCTHPDFRGRGYARLMLVAAHAWLAQQPIDFCYLCGSPEVYGGSGYRLIDNPVRSQDYTTGEWRTERPESSMVRPLGQRDWPAGEIDWRGFML